MRQRQEHKDFIGKKFGKLEVVQRTDQSKWNSVLWKCKCECGNETLASTAHLRNGDKQSCGCLQQEQRKKAKTFAGIYHKGKIKASRGQKKIVQIKNSLKNSKRPITWDISPEEEPTVVAWLENHSCVYCGARDKHMGLDRVDSKVKSYCIGNIVPSCTACNVAKHEMSVEEFLTWIKRVYEFNNLNESH